MNLPGHSWAAILDGVLIAIIAAVIVWILRRVESVRPQNGVGKADAEKFRKEVRNAILLNEEWQAQQAIIDGLKDRFSNHVVELRAIRADVRELQLRLERLEEGTTT